MAVMIFCVHGRYTQIVWKKEISSQKNKNPEISLFTDCCPARIYPIYLAHTP
jgi:hypothetical protein